jgi:hypothetical protein
LCHLEPIACLNVRPIRRDFSRNKSISDPSQQQQDNHNQKNQAKSTAGIVSPSPTVRPGRQYAEDGENQNNYQYCTHVTFSFPAAQ